MSTQQCQQPQPGPFASQLAALTINSSQFGAQPVVPVSSQDEKQQQLLNLLRARWSGFNRDYFNGRLRQPQLGLDLKEPGTLGVCRKSIAFGGQVQISINY